MPGITAPRTFRPGDEVYRLQPFVRIVCAEFIDKNCSSCFKRSENLKSCMNCHYVKYCGKSCQKKDWSNHRVECQYLKNLPKDEDAIDLNLVRMSGIIILKIKGKDWKTIKSNVLGTDVSFDDIDSRVEEITGNHVTMLHYKATKELVRRFIGDENMPHDDDVLKIFGKFINSVAITFGGPDICLDIGFAMFDLECIPNCSSGGNEKFTKLWARKLIKKSEKISIPHNDRLLSKSKLRGNECKCTECSLPYGESVLSKIIDEKRASHVISASEVFLKMWDHFPVAKHIVAMNKIAENLLKMQEGVLANTNILHLKLLAIKCFDIGGPPLEMKRCLKKLEKYTIAVFGEYCLTMAETYKNLSDVCFLLGDMIEGFMYLEKLKVIMKYTE